MASGFFASGVTALLNGSTVWTSSTIEAMLVNAQAGHYVPNLATGTNITDISGGDQIASSAQLTTPTCTNGALGSDNTVVTAPAAGNFVGGIAIYDTGSGQLLIWIDLTVGSLTFTTNGNDVDINPASGIWGTI